MLGAGAALLLVALPIRAAVSPPAADYVPGRILVRPKASLAEPDFQALVRSLDATEQLVVTALNIRALELPEEKAASVLETLRGNPNIEFAERDCFFAYALSVNDPYVTSGSEWHIAKVQAPQAWDITVGNTNVIIAIVDSGVNAAHPDLAGRVTTGFNFVDNDTITTDDERHGTPVAGAAAASANNGIGVAGLAPGCLILPLKVSNPSHGPTAARIAQAVNYATDHGARVINISLSSPAVSSTVQSAIHYAWSNNVVIVASAGNTANNVPQYPAAASNVVAVSATDSADALASFSSYGGFVTLSAPGVAVWTTAANLAFGYLPEDGTSFSSPIVAGIAALVASANPSLSNTQIVSILRQSADDLGPAGYDNQFGYGRVNAYRALALATAAAPVLQEPMRTGTNQVMIAWSAVSGRTYRVQSISSPADTNWITLAPDVTATNVVASKTDHLTDSQRFYRVIQLP